ncbi:MAG: aminotransferase class I/II-fold pyridoxal phosphate-dependent enzyme [Erysipelotrichaceae bacterium]|nr:aminotransferase class I/II-fold pyridoxal phosphate-dependent enzyme [Erysipelotrichaceae bacterium]
MQGLVLAAGMGSRLKRLTKNQTKGMVEVNGVSLMERMLRQFIKCGLKRIIVVIGYEGKKLQNYINGLNLGVEIVYINNEIYDKTNNIYSLYLAKDEMIKNDTILVESDLIFDDEILKGIIDDDRSNLALVDKYEAWMDGTCLEIDDNDHITKFIPGSEFDFNNTDNYYKTVNIYKFSKEFSKNCYFPFMEAYISSTGVNQYYERVFKSIIELNDSLIYARRIQSGKWYEIDDEQDLDIASSLFCDAKTQLDKMFKRYGGYWRYPKVLDFCYLVNPYFPPQKLVDELKAGFKVLLTQYPSGMGVNSLLAAKNFGIKQENIIVGNGAAELIKSLMSKLKGRVGFVRPTFEEYPNRYNIEESISYYPDNNNYSYNADDVINFFKDKDIVSLIIVNPDNPTGNYIFKNDMLKLVEWTKERNITFILDESFVDFADELDSTFIKQEILINNKHLFVMKSISKSYGIPGLRLGVLASGDNLIMDELKKDVSIWNINSFAEYYLQIAEKYKKDYEKALVLIRNERARFENELSKIKDLRIIHSQANYVMVELIGKIGTQELTEKLLVKHNILIKDLSAKMNGKQYLRLAVRDENDDNKLLKALEKEVF